MSCSARSSIEQNMETNQIKSIAKNYSYDEQNQIFTSETCSSNNSPSESCYSQGDQAKSIFNIEDYLVSTNKNQESKDDFSSAISAAAAQESTTLIDQMSFTSLPLNNLHSIFSNSQFNESSSNDFSYTPATKKSSQKKVLARKSTFLEDQLLDKMEKKVKGNENENQKAIHEIVEFFSNDGSKTFNFNCFPERFLGIPAEFQDKNIAHNSDNDADSSDETIQNACRYNLRKIKLELMDLSTTFRYSHFHIDFDKVSSQYKVRKQSKKDNESLDSSNTQEMTQQQQQQQQQQQKQEEEEEIENQSRGCSTTADNTTIEPQEIAQ